MAQSLVKLDQKTGQIISVERNYDFANFVPQNTEQYRYLIADTDIQSVFIPVSVITPEQTIYERESPTPEEIANSNEIDPATGEPRIFAGIPPAAGSTTIAAQYNTVELPNISEQKLAGTPYGTLLPGEVVFQSNRRAEVFNNYTVNGNVVSEYTPVIGTVGACSGTVVGINALQLKGTYLDLPAIAAGGLRVPGGYSLENCNYHLISGHLYLQSGLPSSYDPVLCCVCESITAGSSMDAYAVVYDNTSSRLQFKWTTNASPTYSGFEHSVNASPQGITLNQWHHLAVAYYFDGVSTSVATFFNGTIVASSSGNSAKLRTTNRPFCIGSDQYGNRPFRGWVDDWIVSGGATLDALRGFTFSGGATVPSQRQDSGDYTVFYLSMDGPSGTTFAPCDTDRKIVAVLDVQDVEGNCYVSMVEREDGSTHGVPLYSGICGGFQISGVCGSSFLFGYKSAAALKVNSVEQLLTIDEERSQRERNSDLSYRLLLGGSRMYGTLGKTGDFSSLLLLAGTGFSGGTFTFIPVQTNINALQYLRDDIVNNNLNGTYYLQDSYGTAFSFNTAGVKALYADVLRYHSSSSNSNSYLKTTLQASSDFSVLKATRGYTTDQLLFKLSALADKNPVVYISAVSKITGKYINPERARYTDPDTPPKPAG
jgi:hypothetical protein